MPALGLFPRNLATAALDVGETTDLFSFMRLEGEWNALVMATSDEFVYRHEFLHVWMQCFGTGARLRILTGRDKFGRLTAALPLMQRVSSWHGVRLQELIATANSHSSRWDLVAEDSQAAGTAFFDHLARDKTWDVLKLIDVPDGGNAYHLYRAAQAAGFPAAAWESQRSPYLDLPRSGEDLEGRPSSQTKALVRRRRRQLLKAGDLRLEHLTGEGIGPALEEFFAIESRGWKGRGGTACRQEAHTAEFYALLATAACRLGKLSFFRLRLDGRTIAFHYGVTYGGTYYLLKLGYDEAFGEFSPGLVLMDSVVQDALSRGLHRLDFLGSDDEWKLRWSSGVRRHQWLFIFRDSTKGRFLKKARFDWLPRIKRLWDRGRTE